MDCQVAVPVRGAGCVLATRLVLSLVTVAVPVRGAGCVLKAEAKAEKVAASYRPREGCGLRLDWSCVIDPAFDELPSP